MQRNRRWQILQRSRCFSAWHRSIHNSRRLRLFSASAGAFAVLTLTTGFLLYGQTIVHSEAKGQWFRLHTVRCDSGQNYTIWSRSIPIIGSRQDTHARGRAEDAATSRYVAEGAEAEQEGRKEQPPPPQTPAKSEKIESEQAEDESAWQGLTTRVSSIGDKITRVLVPDWAKLLPAFITKLQDELSAAPGSLAEQIWHEANDPESNPEIIWDASVRISNDLCEEEKAFLRHRRQFTRRALAKYLGLKESEVHPDDVPTIAMCGSGGGLRALVASAASSFSAHEAGLFDCVTYTAGVSGCCWLQALYYSSISGQNHEKLIKHLKNRLGVHIAFPPPALSMLSSAPTNKYLLSGLVEKLKGVPDADYGIVDLYGLLLAARLLVPKGELAVDELDLKVSNQRRFTDNGAQPLPIYTAVRHEIPLEEKEEEGEKVAQARARAESWFQWFEFTPYEFWCEEFEAGIPTWAIGRKFDGGKTVWRENGLALPEIRIPLLLGVWGSAFCATLSHYYKEIRPIMQTMAAFKGIDQLIAERDSDLVKVHPIEPATIPNFVIGLENMLPPSCPRSIFSTTHLQLMDAGMSNNLPIYPLLRPGRNVDIIIAFDASRAVRSDNWLKVVDGYARQRGIKGWPVGAGWPPLNETDEQIAADLEAAQAETEEDAAKKLEEAREQDAKQNMNQTSMPKPDGLGYCSVWVGTTEERSSDEEPPPSKLVEEDWELMRPDAGIAVIYFPFLANPKVEGVDPQTTDFMSTWNFVYTPEQIDSVVAVARANFEEGKEQTRQTVRAVYERKRAIRLAREGEEKRRRRQLKLRRGSLGKRLGEGDHGDQFS